MHESTGQLLVYLYMDDIIYMGLSQSAPEESKAGMTHTFEMSDLGSMRYFLGLEIRQSRGCISVSQCKFAENLIRRFNVQGCKRVSTPMHTDEKVQEDDRTRGTDARRYRSIVRGLLYISHTRLNIAFTIGVASRFMNKPSYHHLGAIKRIMYYKASTIDSGILHERIQEFELSSYTNSD